ncbi:unnamed protein product [Larinioides sclopetarius]|uniref:Uncharacterized protein n=1 Tax=Larinioides sclopetarius TaxID=280406 RepID=A0AAV2B5N2_9ARAC
MSKTGYTKCSNFFVIAFLIKFIHFCVSAPVTIPENAYTQFLSELNRNKCSVPSQVHLPFNTTTKLNNFEYLSSSLEICQKTESAKRTKEAVVLCKEIFDNIRNISCPAKTALPDISVSLSMNVCQDIGALKDSVPENDKSLLKRLTDGFLCDIMCDSEFEKACQVLLWSFEVQKQIASVTNAQELKQPNVLGDGEDINVDSNKQSDTIDENGLAGNSVDPENEKMNSEEVKDVNEVVGHAGIPEVPERSKLEDIHEKKVDTVTNDKISVLENLAVSSSKNQDLTGTSQFASSVKTLSSVTQQMSSAQVTNLDAELKPLEESTKDESNYQNMNKLQSDVPNKEEGNAEGDLLLHVSNTNVNPNEQTQDVTIDTLADRTAHDIKNTLADRIVQDKKDTDILANGHAQDNSSIPATQNVPVDEENNPGNEIPDETPEKGEISKFPISNDLPHEPANEKSTTDAAADLHHDEQNPSNLVNTIDQSKLQSTASNDDNLAKKMNSSTINSQAIKDTAIQQIVPEVTEDKTSITRDETKADQPQTNSILKKVEETQDHTKADAMTNDLITDDGAKNPSTDEKKPKVAQQKEESSNTIPDTTGTPIIIDEKLPEKSQKLKPTVVNPNGKSVIPSSLTETSTKTAVALEKMEGGSDLRQPPYEETDHYGDLENTEGDEYPGVDYGNGGFGEVPKSKASDLDVPSPITAAKEIIASHNEKPMDFPSRNAFGQDVNDIQMISSFPEQEDSHFFFYFLSIVLIMMAGYLIFHNKQKIIALIVEGRHERNRRSHRIGYKKLETK